MTTSKTTRSNLSQKDHDDEREYGPLTGNLTWGVRTRNADGLLRPSEQEDMFWTSLSGVNDNDE